MAIDKFNDILKDDIIKKASAKIESAETIEDTQVKKEKHRFQLNFESKEEYMKVKRYAKSKKLTVTSLILNMLAEKGII